MAREIMSVRCYGALRRTAGKPTGAAACGHSDCSSPTEEPMRRLILGLITTTGLMLPHVAFSSDHLANAQAPFGNPVVNNPSGVSGGAATPGDVPGTGNPNAGQDRTTPAVDPELLPACDVGLSA